MIRAYAKLNLYLHVRGKISSGAHEGYHDLESLIVFAEDVYDELSVEESSESRITITGPFSASVDPLNNNLLTLLTKLKEMGYTIPPLHISLHKHIPVGAGLGGGTSDVAALLRYLISRYHLPIAGTSLDALLLSLGADVPVCYHRAPAIVRGVGEHLTAYTTLPPLHAVLVFPRIHLSTKSVFQNLHAYRLSPLDITVPFMDLLHQSRNDLTESACQLEPVVAEALNALATQPAAQHDILLARMSGSGSTCFALTDTAETALQIAKNLQTAYPDWWMATTRIARTTLVS